jgi:glycosyltransferase involved in cell wall biosynthesis
VIRGSGVDTNVFTVTQEARDAPIVMLPARMLWDKGIAEFVEAARILLKRGATARFVLVGMIDKENSSAIPESRIRAWQKEGLVEWWGHREDMPTVLAAANVVVLPSIEGFVENPELRRTAGRRGRQIAEQEFSLARIAGETIAVYRNLLGESSRWMSARRVSETRA